MAGPAGMRPRDPETSAASSKLVKHRVTLGPAGGTELAIGTAMRALSPITLLLTAASALTAFVALARAVEDRQLKNSDRALRDDVQSLRTPSGDSVASAVGPLGKEWLHGPLALGISYWLWRHGTGGRSAVPAIASAVSAIGSAVFEHTTHLQPATWAPLARRAQLPERSCL